MESQPQILGKRPVSTNETAEMFANAYEAKPHECVYCICVCLHAWIQRRGGAGAGGPDSLRNHKNIGIISSTGPEPLKNHKAFNVGPSSARRRNAI